MGFASSGAYRDYLPTPRFQPSLGLSPDGQHVAYIDDGLGQFNVVVQPVAGGEPRRLTSYRDFRVEDVVGWPKGGRSVVFLSDAGGDEMNQLYEVDTTDGGVRPLTAAPRVQHHSGFGGDLSPDGGRLVYAANDRDTGEQDLLVRELATGEVRRVYAGGGRVFPGFWSPDGAWLTAQDSRSAMSDHDIYLVPASGGPARRVTPEGSEASCWPGPWLPDGRRFLVVTNLGRDFSGLAAMDAGTGELSWLDAPDWDVEDVTLSADGRRLLWTVNVDGASQLRGRDLVTGTDLHPLSLLAGVVSVLRITSDGRYAVMLLSTPTRPQNVSTLDLGTGDLRWLTASRPAAATPVRLVTPTLTHIPARDGQRIPAYLYRPATGAGPTGVVMAIHGGPPMQERPSYSNDGFLQYLVDQGVAVLAPNIRGSSGYGMTYQRQSHRDWGGGDLGDVADLARWLQRQSWVDPTRIGLVGRSYGGFVVLSAVARLPEVGWAAAVAWCGPANLVTFTRSQPPTWRSQVSIMIGDPERDEEFLRSRSPVTYADQIQAPLMVIQGANDPRVPKRESDQIVAGLRARGVEVRYEVYPDEGHLFGKRQNQIRAQSDAGEFLLAHLVRRKPAGRPRK